MHEGRREPGVSGSWEVGRTGYVSLLSSELCALALSCYLSEPQFAHL